MNAASFRLLFHRTSSAIPAQLEASHSAKLLKIVHKHTLRMGTQPRRRFTP